MSGGEDMVVLVANMVLQSDLKTGEVSQSEVCLIARCVFSRVIFQNIAIHKTVSKCLTRWPVVKLGGQYGM